MRQVHFQHFFEICPNRIKRRKTRTQSAMNNHNAIRENIPCPTEAFVFDPQSDRNSHKTGTIMTILLRQAVLTFPRQSNL